MAIVLIAIFGLAGLALVVTAATTAGSHSRSTNVLSLSLGAAIMGLTAVIAVAAAFANGANGAEGLAEKTKSAEASAEPGIDLAPGPDAAPESGAGSDPIEDCLRAGWGPVECGEYVRALMGS